MYDQLREEIIRMLAHVEAYIDFEADEVADDVTEKVF
jgi:tRNA U34 5-carboxymethylaminomethyl modifying GTPase MnmE/TrmE